MGAHILSSDIDRRISLTTPETTDYKYDLDGNVDEIDQSNGVTSDYAYDDLNRLIDLTHFKDANGNSVFDTGDTLIGRYEYDLNADGTRKQATETDDQGNQDVFYWDYDGLSRLVSEALDSSDNSEDYITKFVYDLTGNRTSQQSDTAAGTAPDVAGFINSGVFSADSVTNYTYDNDDRLLTEITDADGTANDTFTSYTYAQDEQIGKEVHEGLTDQGTLIEQDTFEYNLQGRMSKATVTKGGTTTVSEYTYNTEGIRVKQTVTTDGGTPQVTQYLIDPNNPTGLLQTLEEKDGSGNITKTYTLGLDVLTQHDTTNGALTLLYDGHGSTRVLTDPLGQILQKYKYRAYGNMITGTGLTTSANALTNLLYSGETTDQATGLQYLKQRYYDPNTGRFNRNDPAGPSNDPLSLHRYLYANANPIMNTDPTGRMTLVTLSISLDLDFKTIGIYTAATIGAGIVGAGLAYGILYAMPFIKAAAASGVAGAGQAVGQAMSHLSQVAAAVNAAVASASLATGISPVRLRLMPVWPVWDTITHRIHDETANYLANVNPAYHVLTFDGLLNPQTRANRAWVRRRYRNVVTPATRAQNNNSLDEFPYASTQQGGVAGPAVGWAVPLRENLVQGGLLGAFYRFVVVWSPRDFLVVPIP